MIPVIELRHVFMDFEISKSRKIYAAKDVNMEINQGEIVTLVGESGCGKSTIGRICLGVQKPTTGAVFYNGKYIWDSNFHWDRKIRTMVQVVHQDSFASLNPVKTVYQTLSGAFLFHGITRGRRETIEKVKELLVTVGLNPPEFFVNKYPFQLSGGQRQRVSIARATILRPKIIIADEPVSGVDASLRLSILDLMRKLNRDLGIGFLYITHDLATARYFGRNGKMIVMYLGSIVEQGRIEKLIDKPAHPYLRALLSAIPSPDPEKARKKIDLPLKSIEMPDPAEPPPGCLFNPRCPYAQEICEKEIPVLEGLPDDPEHLVACHLKENL
ncbi:MAG: ABC transporter ATP-binding protein [Candidatus Eremiobacteraeota bacterium]|nr:ABC transporter ATP-binding protein [Candidatus Eremiobacteraeota bacterium]